MISAVQERSDIIITFYEKEAVSLVWLGYMIAAAVIGWAIYCIVRSVKKKGCGCKDCSKCSGCKK